MGVATAIIFIYLAAEFENGKGLGELLSPFDLFGFIFWLYIAFLVSLIFILPNEKQGQKIHEDMLKKEGEFKVLYFTNDRLAREMANRWVCDFTPMNCFYQQWFDEIQSELLSLGKLSGKIEKAKGYVRNNHKHIREANEKIRFRQRMRKGDDDAEIIKYREEIKGCEERIKKCEENIEKYKKELASYGWDEYRQPLNMTWDEVFDYIRKERTLFWIKKVDKD